MIYCFDTVRFVVCCYDCFLSHLFLFLFYSFYCFGIGLVHFYRKINTFSKWFVYSCCCSYIYLFIYLLFYYICFSGIVWTVSRYFTWAHQTKERPGDENIIQRTSMQIGLFPPKERFRYCFFRTNFRTALNTFTNRSTKVQ